MFSEEKFGSNRIGTLRNRITVMYTHGTSPKELGDAALEILIARNEVESMLEKDPKNAKIREVIRQLRQLEKALISLYVMKQLGKASQLPYSDYLNRQYTIFQHGED